MLTLIMVTASAFMYSEVFIRDFLRYGRLPFNASFDGGGLLMLVFASWLGLRGGRVVTGCLALLNAFFFLIFITCSLGTAITACLPMASWPDFVWHISELDTSRASLYFVIAGILATFSLWVLVASKDARRYRKVRRKEIVQTEANAFEWPPPSRR